MSMFHLKAPVCGSRISMKAMRMPDGCDPRHSRKNIQSAFENGRNEEDDKGVTGGPGGGCVINHKRTFDGRTRLRPMKRGKLRQRGAIGAAALNGPADRGRHVERLSRKRKIFMHSRLHSPFAPCHS
jgi:hypothetical protein